MQVKFQAKGQQQPTYDILGETINGIDLSLFPVGGKFTGDDTTTTAGIYGVERDETTGELLVTLAQASKAYQVRVASHDWVSGDYIDSTLYDAATCYLTPTKMPQGCESFIDTDGFCTVRRVEDELV